MAEKFYTLLTDVGKAKIANSAGFGSKVNFVKMKVGDGGGAYYNPTEDQEDLVNTVYEGNINYIAIDEENPNWINVEMMIPANVGGFMIREYGIFDEENNMLGVAKCPETYKPVAADGSTKELLMRMNLEVSNTQNVTLKIDPTIIFAKKSDLEILDNKIKNIKIPVTSVNSKTGAIELKATDIKTEDGKTVDEQLADITTDNKRLTKDKTLTGAINELFTSGNNVKFNTVDALLQIDNSLQINKNDNWDTIINNIKKIKIGDYSIGDTLNSDKIKIDLVKELKEVDTFELNLNLRNNNYLYLLNVDNNEYFYFKEETYNEIFKIDKNSEKVWNVKIDDGIERAFATRNNDIYIITKNNNLKKINSNGQQIWTRSFESEFSYITVNTQGNVYYYKDNILKKLNSDGKEAWSLNINESQTFGSLLCDDENIYYSYSNANRDKILKKLDSNGKEIWSLNLPCNSIKCLNVDSKGNIYCEKVVNETHGYKVNKISPIGKEIWEFHIGDYISSIIIDENDNIYVYSSWNDTFRQITDKGKELWYINKANWVDVVTNKDYFYYNYGSYHNKVIKLQKPEYQFTILK